MSTYATLMTSVVVSRQRSDASQADALTPTASGNRTRGQSTGAHYRLTANAWAG